jgi:acetyl esterase/lipase
MKYLLTIIFAFTFLSYISAQSSPQAFEAAIPLIEPTTKLYKVTPQDSLFADIYYPENFTQGKKKPAIVFFFGGGWVGGDRNHFQRQSRYLASKGMIAITVDYRIKSEHNTSPIEAMEDAKSAMRWVKKNANELGVDVNKLAAGGGSAGGHLAAVTATINQFNAKEDDSSISAKPNLLVLFNPVIDTTPKGYGAKKMGKNQKKASPVRHVKKGIVPTIIFHGTADTTVPFENVERFEKLMKAKGNECKLIAYKDQKHGFFNYRKGVEAYFEKTVKAMEDFLRKYKYIQ